MLIFLKKDEVGWTPRVSLSEGIQAMVKWVKNKYIQK